MSDSSKEFPENFSEESLALPLIKSTMLDKSFGDCPDFAESIIAQLANDLDNPIPCQYDFEFISAYFDNQLFNEFNDRNLLHQRMQTFEQHLPNCALCNEQLGQLHTFTDIYRNHLYRIEQKLESLDFSPMVMHNLSLCSPFQDVLDESAPLQAVGCGVYTPEDFSALLDEELTLQEAENLKTHIEHCLSCNKIYGMLTHFCSKIATFCNNLMKNQDSASMPYEHWSLISKKLAEDNNLQNLKTLPLSRKKSLLPVQASAIAASVVLLFLSASIFFKTPMMQNDSNKTVNAALLEEAILKDQLEISNKQTMHTQNNHLAVIYQSPEAYLFSTKSEIYLMENSSPVDEIQEMDVSEFVLNNSP